MTCMASRIRAPLFVWRPTVTVSQVSVTVVGARSQNTVGSRCQILADRSRFIGQLRPLPSHWHGCGQPECHGGLSLRPGSRRRGGRAAQRASLGRCDHARAGGDTMPIRLGPRGSSLRFKNLVASESQAGKRHCQCGRNLCY
jgi:hypothetical protein